MKDADNIRDTSPANAAGGVVQGSEGKAKPAGGLRPSESRATQVQIVLPQHANSNKRLFGGVLMQWVDIVAGVTARRHAGREVTTVGIDRLDFEAPAFVGDTIQLDGTVTFVGRTSMEVRVDTMMESFGGRDRRRINRAYLVMVAIDDAGCPCEVPALVRETAEEEREWEAGRKRRELRRRRREEQY